MVRDISPAASTTTWRATAGHAYCVPPARAARSPPHHRRRRRRCPGSTPLLLSCSAISAQSRFPEWPPATGEWSHGNRNPLRGSCCDDYGVGNQSHP
ncbi:hypothetical protein LY76DRAFT_401280 [Colletotrichum caudatum]|nr:hypothetical protein LY76DRAFT_401280 [Colletotrichum caudatum]